MHRSCVHRTSPQLHPLAAIVKAVSPPTLRDHCCRNRVRHYGYVVLCCGYKVQAYIEQVNLGIGHSPIKFSQPAIVIAYTQFDLCTVCMYSVSKKIPPPEGPDIFFHFLTNG